MISLVDGRKQVVYGAGPPDADLMFVGEAPGEDEDEKGEPFVGSDPGQAGRILNERLREIRLPRGEVYITNIVKCRPTEVVEGGPAANRPAELEEVDACANWLDEEVRLVQPKLIVPLGVPATGRVLGRSVFMKDVHGKLMSGQESVWKDPRLRIIPTYHPTGIHGIAERWQAFVDDFEKIRDVYRRLRLRSWEEHLRPGQLVGLRDLRTVHKDFGKGIYVPAGEVVARSIRFRIRSDSEWGYSDKWLEPGKVLDYTGQGGPPQHQSWNRWNTGLRHAETEGSYIHVFEWLSSGSYKYWGLGRVTKHYTMSSQGRNVLRFIVDLGATR